MIEQINESKMNIWTNERINEWTYKQMNEWTN